MYSKKPLQRVTLYLKVMTSQNHFTFILHLLLNYLRSHFTTIAISRKFVSLTILGFVSKLTEESL
ncbi:hypothetical protein EFL90_13050 [Lactococcus lactis]|nr:hypothetical protein [Lactococcus lactis]